jgi:hypothetical protein
MKEFSFYLFFLYLFFKVKSLEYEIKSIEINDIFYNYIDIDDKKFLLNPRSEKVVLFGNCQTSKILQSDNKEIDYFDFLRLEIENSCKLDINIDNKPIHFDNVYLFTDKDPFKNMDGYIGIKNGANFIKTLDLKKKHGYKQK